MSQGGARPGAGRPKGRQDSKTLARLEAIKAGGLSPLEYLLRLLRDENQDQHVRVDAAKSAAPYVHPKLANVETLHVGDAERPIYLTSCDGDL